MLRNLHKLDGFFGPQVAAMNLAGVLPWIHWRGLAVLALLIAGNFFCMACPFTFARDLGRKIFPATSHWPRPLRSKWLAIGLLVFFFWAYEFFDLWETPWWTAWIIVFYFVSAVLVDGTSLSFRSSTWATSLYGQVSGAGKIISDPAGGGGVPGGAGAVERARGDGRPERAAGDQLGRGSG
jgi:polyferredoxin